MANTRFNADVAAEAAEEHYSLQKRLVRLEAEEEQQKQAAEQAARYEDSVDTSGVDRARRRNSALREEIAKLEVQLKELQTINVADLQHEYQRLDGRRAHLLNEIASLRRVIANQSKDVRRATRAVNNQRELHRQNDEHHASSNADIQMFKDKRETLAQETQRLIRKERHLGLELETLPAAGEDSEAVTSRLRDDNAKKDQTIERLEATLREKQQQKQQQANTEQSPAATPVDELKRLREEYVRLNDRLKRSKQ
ncbi:hypothetical protein ABB37_04965 [Leptomonas pyrrhocoris]|uniref:Uncharacterized protein n=1 Tax=Leptomonas pyrrhocoris TaxID=157538 RepID=A0A0M9G0V3_LEPPY|nr:hypothetical protein ABB37_04965 [Leptomonas pyrrhocoris]KPA79899.1 hypothetical protein ABB37_04965 [Leptomonas pyrrhocoris]|eukprot:XP_015658338.1 hypothetical protein ABB37_04965 [Leptomonas pyrrhocoris]